MIPLWPKILAFHHEYLKWHQNLQFLLLCDEATSIPRSSTWHLLCWRGNFLNYEREGMPGNCIRGCKLQALVSLRVFWTVRKAIFYPWKVFLRVLCTNNNLRLLSYVEDNIQFNFVSTVWIKNYLCWRLQVRFPGLTSNPCFVLFRFLVALSNFKYQSTSKALVESVGWSVLIITLRFVSLLWVLAPAPCPFFFTCLILAYSRKTLHHESIKILVKHAWHVPRI